MPPFENKTRTATTNCRMFSGPGVFTVYQKSIRRVPYHAPDGNRVLSRHADRVRSDADAWLLSRTVGPLRLLADQLIGKQPRPRLKWFGVGSRATHRAPMRRRRWLPAR